MSEGEQKKKKSNKAGRRHLRTALRAETNKARRLRKAVKFSLRKVAKWHAAVDRQAIHPLLEMPFSGLKADERERLQAAVQSAA